MYYLILIGKVLIKLKKKLNFKLLTFFILPPSKKVLKERLLNRHKKDSKIVSERMRQFEKDVKDGKIMSLL